MTTREGVPVVDPSSSSHPPPYHHPATSAGRVTPGTEAVVSPKPQSSDSKAVASSSSTSIQDQLDPTALKIRKSWRQVVSSAVITFRTADKFRAKLAAVQQQNPHLDTSTMFSKEVDEGIVTSLRARADFRKNLTVLEGKVSGQAQEAEALESCRRTQSRLGRKRRKRDRNVPTTTTKEEQPPTAAATTATTTTVTAPVAPSAPVNPSSTTVPGVVPQQPQPPPTLPITTAIPQVQNPSYSPPPF